MTIPSDERSIDSPRNQSVRRARALERDRDLRERQRIYLAWGLHLAQEALDAGAPLREALIGPRLPESAEGRRILQRLRAQSLPIARTTTRILDSIVEGCGDQGVLLLVARPDFALDSILRQGPTLIVIAHGVQDPGNLGSILRSARAFSTNALITSEGCADPFGSRAVRAAMGAQFTLPVVGIEASASIRAVRGAGLQVVAADPVAEELPPRVDLTRPTALLLGSEGAGLPSHLLRAAERRVRIPMARGVSSLNVHAAAVALLYETARQRGFKQGPDPGEAVPGAS
jgi:RNA methyltransferase, TrmH family